MDCVYSIHAIAAKSNTNTGFAYTAAAIWFVEVSHVSLNSTQTIDAFNLLENFQRKFSFILYFRLHSGFQATAQWPFYGMWVCLCVCVWYMYMYQVRFTFDVCVKCMKIIEHDSLLWYRKKCMKNVVAVWICWTVWTSSAAKACIISIRNPTNIIVSYFRSFDRF